MCRNEIVGYRTTKIGVTAKELWYSEDLRDEVIKTRSCFDFIKIL
jgi:hypothetical protein